MAASKTNESEGRRGWQITAIVAIITILIQVAGWVWWFGGWKSTTDLRLDNVEGILKDLPGIINSMRTDQKIMSSKLDDYLSRREKD